MFWRCAHAVCSSYLVWWRRQPCRIPTRRLPRARRAWWWRSGSAALVVVGAGSRAACDRTERPGVDGVVEAAVADMAGQHGTVFARRGGQRGGSGGGFSGLGVGVSVRVVPELAKHPGAEDDTKSWQGAVDVGVRVCLKMCREFGFELADLAIEFGDDADRSAGAGPERGSERGGCGELLGAQHFLNLQCAGVEVALSSSGFGRRP